MKNINSINQENRATSNNSTTTNAITTGAVNTPITEETTLGELLSIIGPVERADKTPTSKKLREEAGEPIATEERCMVYANGYAVYDNGSGRTVVWLPGCTSYTYHFDPMKDSEKGGDIKETFALPDGYLESQPWPVAVTLIGDHRIEMNCMNRTGGRTGTKDYDSDDNGDKDGDAEDAVEKSYRKEYVWREDQIGESPETVYIRKETRREMLEAMTEKQREVFVLYYQEGYTQQAIADLLGITQRAVNYRLEGATGHIRKFQKIF